MVKQIDQNGDGLVEFEEDLAYWQNHGTIPKNLSDGELNKRRENFNRGDLDGDGKKSADELYWKYYEKYATLAQKNGAAASGPAHEKVKIEVVMSGGNASEARHYPAMVETIKGMKGIAQVEVVEGKALGTGLAILSSDGSRAITEEAVETFFDEILPKIRIEEISIGNGKESGPLVGSQEWTNTDGRTITASVQKIEGDLVYFVLPDGKEVPYEMAKLSAEDVDRLKALAK